MVEYIEEAKLAFLRDMQRDPYDNGVRLIYADWLEEHGELDRAQYIRLCCELEGSNVNTLGSSKKRAEIEAKITALREKHKDEEGYYEYLLGLPKGALATLDLPEEKGKWKESRGFVCSLDIKNLELKKIKEQILPYIVVDNIILSAYLRGTTLAKELHDFLPETVRHLNIFLDVASYERKAVIDSLFPENAKFNLASLLLNESNIDNSDEVIKELAEKKCLKNLTELDIGGLYHGEASITDKGAEIISKTWPNLVSLRLGLHNKIGENGFESIGKLTKLEELNLQFAEPDYARLEKLKNLQLKNLNVTNFDSIRRQELCLIADQFKDTLEFLRVSTDNIGGILATALIDDFPVMKSLETFEISLGNNVDVDANDIEDAVSVLADTGGGGTPDKFPKLISLGDREEEILGNEKKNIIGLVSEETREEWEAAVKEREGRLEKDKRL